MCGKVKYSGTVISAGKGMKFRFDDDEAFSVFLYDGNFVWYMQLYAYQN